MYLTTYAWDPLNRLLSVKQSQPGAVDLTNSYRPDGMRHRRTDATGTTQMIWDGDELLAQVDTSGNLVEYWTWASAIGALGVGALGGGGRPSWEALRLVKARIPGSANPDQYLHSDWQGTVLAASGPTGAALVQNYPPRPWGPDGPGLTPLSWLGNHGYWYEGGLARPMHYVRARWYPDVGAANGGGTGWLSVDPVGFEGGDWNLYRYVGNRPTVEVDPSGLDGCCGPSVTIPLMNVLRKVRRTWQNWGTSKAGLSIKLRHCQNLYRHDPAGPQYDPGTPIYEIAWDIRELFANDPVDPMPWLNDNPYYTRHGCALPQSVPGPDRVGCKSTVRVAGSCFYAGSVNYVLWGLMNSLCASQFGIRYGLGTAKLAVTLRKYLRVWNYQAAKDWTVAGFNGWPGPAGPTPDSDTPWCIRFCGQPYNGPPFSVFWYPDEF